MANPTVEQLPRDFQFKPPPGFENYFTGKETLPITKCEDLLPQIRKIELGRFINRLDLYELADADHMERHMILMEDMEGRKALMFVVQDTMVPENHNPIYGPLNVIGGTGVYVTPEGQSPAEFALNHTYSLAVAMCYKTAMAGLREAYGLSGMKATVAMEKNDNGLSNWEESPILQQATGWLYSPGNFSRAMTGTDARQTPYTIGAMDIGSALAVPERRSIQICGTRKNFDTPGACSFSLEATLDVLQEQGLSKGFKDNTISIQGFGRIGHAALELALQRGAKTFFISDVKFSSDGKITITSENSQLYWDLIKLQQTHSDSRITIVTNPNDIYSQPADIFMPCSSQEEQLTEETLGRLQQAGVKTILSGANKILDQKNIWILAKRAADLGIVMPPEVLSNCGSVTMAGMERLYHSLRKNDPTYIDLPEEAAEIKFRDEIVVPFIRNNAQNRINQLLEIAKEMQTDIYSAGEIWYLRQQGKEAKVDANGMLISST